MRQHMDVSRESASFSHFTPQFRANVLGMQRECLVAEDGSPFADRFFVVSSILKGQLIPPFYHGLPKE
jgi:hypothetical protein